MTRPNACGYPGFLAVRDVNTTLARLHSMFTATWESPPHSILAQHFMILKVLSNMSFDPYNNVQWTYYFILLKRKFW